MYNAQMDYSNIFIVCNRQNNLAMMYNRNFYQIFHLLSIINH